MIAHNIMNGIRHNSHDIKSDSRTINLRQK